MDPDSPIKIKEFNTEWEAEMARINLGGEDIFAVVKPRGTRGYSRAAVLVRAKDVSRALEVLRDLDMK